MVLVAILLSVQTYAAALDCLSLTAKTLKPGVQCTTSKKIIFRLESIAANGDQLWEDIQSGIVWTDRLPERYAGIDAAAACAKLPELVCPNRLPLAKDFETLEAHGGREALPHMKDHFYWTGTTHPKAANARKIFSGNFGTTNWVSYINIPYESTRCICYRKK